MQTRLTTALNLGASCSKRMIVAPSTAVLLQKHFGTPLCSGSGLCYSNFIANCGQIVEQAFIPYSFFHTAFTKLILHLYLFSLKKNCKTMLMAKILERLPLRLQMFKSSIWYAFYSLSDMM